MANNNAYYLLYGYTGSSTVVLRFELGFTTAGGYRVRVNALNNASTWTNSAWVNITDGVHYFELDWQSGTSGRVDWWIDGAAQAAVTGFDNSARRIDQVRLGTVAGLDTGTTGTVYFDAFESRRQTFIGAGTAIPDAIFADDFESGGFSYWSANTGVSVTTAASLAPVGTRGMSCHFGQRYHRKVRHRQRPRRRAPLPGPLLYDAVGPLWNYSYGIAGDLTPVEVHDGLLFELQVEKAR